MYRPSLPIDPSLRTIWDSLPDEPTETHSSLTWQEMPHITAQHWAVSEEHAGYHHVRVDENPDPSFPRYGDIDILALRDRAAAITLLGRSSVSPLMRAAGILTERNNIDPPGGLPVTFHHVAYPGTNVFVTTVNTALDMQGHNLRFTAFEGGTFPAKLLAESLAANTPTVPISTEAKHSGHDILIHALGWLALPPFYTMVLSEHAREVVRLDNPDEYAKFGNLIEATANSRVLSAPRVHGNSLLRLSELACESAETVQNTIHAHLYA